ncbi:jg25921 [Pararge aegeria aegeria]|uniref:Jg25921 protein n=1 Tax=Pararge aegeria aegeria TaxID=348720 RepID=A0A8S4QEI9_9NEOP|nr:jg25921 [Pararge aegeria aegeria]
MPRTSGVKPWISTVKRSPFHSMYRKLLTVSGMKVFCTSFQPTGYPLVFATGIADFLSGRFFRVVVDGSSSDLMAINAGVPQGSVLSATLFLLHINDLLKPGILGYADDSTVTVRYMSSPRASGDETLVLREALVERVNLALSEVSDWGDTNLVQFNASKTQACLFSAKRSPFPLSLTFRNVSVPITNSIELLGISISSNLSFGQCIESKAKTAGKKLGILNKVKRYFTPEQLLTLYQAQVRSCMECSQALEDIEKIDLADPDLNKAATKIQASFRGHKVRKDTPN